MKGSRFEAVLSEDPIQVITVTNDRFHKMLDLLGTAFPDVDRAFFYSITHNDPWFHPSFRLAVEKENKPVSCLQIFDRTMRFDRQSVRFGGIGSVGTHPNHRSKGYSSILLNRACEIMEQEGMVGSLLFTRINPFYERLGWRTLHQYEQEISVQSIKRLFSSSIQSRVLQPKDYSRLQEVYSQMQETRNGTLLRNEAYWNARTSWMNHTGKIIMQDDQFAGYYYGANYNHEKPVMTVTEYGYRDADSLPSLMAGMASLAEEKRCSLIRGFFLQDPVLREFLLDSTLEMVDLPFDFVLWRDIGKNRYGDSMIAAVAEKRFLYWQTDAF